MTADNGDVVAPKPSSSICIEMPSRLHPETQRLVIAFAEALALKLRANERKYGYGSDWSTDDWESECRRQMLEHLGKGDPRDVAIYAAFMWRRGWSTAPVLDRLRSLAGSVPECQFLLDRLSGLDFSGCDDDFVRDWFGHVDPAISRFQAAISTPPVASSPVAPVAETTLQRVIDLATQPLADCKNAALMRLISIRIELGISAQELKAAAKAAPQTTVSSGLSTITKDWCETMARSEGDDDEISAGSPDHPLRTLPQEAQPKVGGDGLLPCPFCGASASKIPDPGHSTAWEIRCSNPSCAVEPSAWDVSEVTALEKWNRRALPSSSSAERARAIEALTVAHSALEQIRHESDCDDPEFEIIDRRHHQDLETAFQKIVVALRSLKQQENG